MSDLKQRLQDYAENLERSTLKPPPKVITDALERIKALEAGLKPFADAFLKKRTEYAKRYGDDVEIGFKNFDKMPDKWEMDGITFSMGTFRTAASLLEAKP